MSESSRIVSSRELWPMVAAAFGLDPKAQFIHKFELIIDNQIPVVRLEMFVSAGEAMSLRSVLQDYNLVPVNQDDAENAALQVMSEKQK